MNKPVGGELFLKHFTEQCVEEAIKQEGLERYRQRIDNLKKIPDILLDILSTSLRILSILLHIFLATCLRFGPVLSCVLTFFMCLLFLASYSYNIVHYRTCDVDLDKRPFLLIVDTIILAGANAFAPACKIFNKDLLGLLNDQVYNSRLWVDDSPKIDTCSGGSSSWAREGPPGPHGNL